MKSENKLAGLGVLTAISASLCCITPVLALLAGTSGLASTFSWLNPLRPYLIGLTVLVIGLAWYQKLKPQKPLDCNCATNEKTPFIQTKAFLGIVTVFVGIMLAFPTYAHIFFPKTEKQPIVTEQANIQKAEFTISGMSCTGCEEHVNHEVNKLKGIMNTIVSYQNGNAIVEFDKTKTNVQEIEEVISKTGYAVTANKEIK
jgi:copper chaperone CopZ